MLLKDSKVIRPNKTKVLKKNNVRYVYAVTDVFYDSNKKYSNDHRVCIGKMIDDTYMIPNDKFLSFYPESFIELKQASNDFSDTVSIGDVLLINKLANDLGIKELLDTLFKDKSSLIMDLISYMIIKESCVFEHFEYFERKSITSTNRIYSDSRVSSLLKDEISYKDIELFLDAWNKLNANKLNDVYLNVDGSNINVRSDYDGLAEYGYAKDDKDLRQINISYVSSNEDGTPLSYDLYPGSIHDSNELNTLLKHFDRYGYKNIGLIFDRAYYSASQLKKLKERGFSYIFMLRENLDFIKKIIDEDYYSLKEQTGCYLKEYNLSFSSKRVNISNDLKKPLTAYAHVFYSSEAHSEKQSIFLTKISRMNEELDDIYNNHKTISKEELTKYKKYFKLRFDNNGYLLAYKQNDKAINQEKRYYGFFALLTSKKMTSLEALSTYKQRDSIEKLFRVLKTSLEFDHVGVHYKSSLESKVFITFIASIIRNEIFKRSLSLKENERKTFTVPKIINTLSTIEATLNTNDIYFRKYALTNNQKKLLNIMNIKEKDIDNYINNFNKSLSKKSK